MTLIHIWASPAPVDSGAYLGIIETWYSLIYLGLTLTWSLWSHLYLTWTRYWFPQGPHLDLVTQVLIYASWDLVSQFHSAASPGPSDSRPPLGLTLTW